MSDALVTGAAGFIGSHLVPALEADGHDVTTLDIADSADITTNVADYDNFGSYEAVYHLAAISDIRQCEVHPRRTWRANVLGTFNLCEQLTSDQDLVFPSTDHVYGRQRLGRGALTECSTSNPLSLYGLTKLVGEHIIRYYARSVGFHYCIYRLFSVYGPGQRRGWLVPDVIEKCRTQDVVAIRDPEVHQSMTYVDDAVDVLARDVVPPGTYNVCAPNCRSVEEVYREIAAHFDAECIPEEGKQVAACGDNTKISRYYDDWTPLEEGIERTIAAA